MKCMPEVCLKLFLHCDIVDNRLYHSVAYIPAKHGNYDNGKI